MTPETSTPRTDEFARAECCDLEHALDFARQLERELAAERALTDRLAALIRRYRVGYGGHVVDPECNCYDCKYLSPIDQALAAWKEARK